jgi:dolichol-phosphate mannosyltransferase
MSEPTSRLPIASQPLSMVLVACNVAADIESVVATWNVQLDALNRSAEIILVDDGSTDETPALADKIATQNKRVRVFHHPTRQGFGDALRTGIAAAKHPLVAHTTCDRQYQPAELKLFLEHIDKVDVVTGYRQWLPVPPTLRFMGRIYRLAIRVLFGVPLEPLPSWLGDHGQRKRWLARWLFGVRVHDVECAFRLFRRSVLAWMPIQSHGPFALVEMLAKANFLGCWMFEVPVSYQPPKGPLVHGSLDPKDSYLGEAKRLFKDAVFAAG